MAEIDNTESKEMDLDSSLDNKDCESSENSTSMLRCDETLELAND